MATNNHIPISIVSKILSRLPVKSLVRFRVVCKEWDSTICDPKFRRSCVSRFLWTVCNREDRSLSFFISPPATAIAGAASFSLEPLGKLPLDDDYCFTKLQGLATKLGDGVDPASRPIQFPLIESVHGLIIVENEHNVVIYNPFTRESKRLPDADPVVVNGGLYENQRPYGNTALHYDPVSGEYICIRIQRHPDRHSDCLIIGLKDSEWRKLPRPPKRQAIHYSGFDPTTAYLGGNLYLGSFHGRLVRFRPCSGSFEKVIMPAGLDPKVLFYVLFIYRGKLAITSRRMENSFDRCLFTLEDEAGKLWTRIPFVADSETRRKVKQCEKRGITDGGEIILVNRDLRMQNDIYYYDPSNGNLRVLVAEVTGLAEVDFKTHFGDHRPRALLHTDYVEHLMFFK